MKKLFFAATFVLVSLTVKAQYGTINAVLDRLEERRGINQDLNDINLDDKKFVLVKDFDDHTERDFIVIKGNNATYVEIFDDKKTGQSSTNLFTGNLVRTKRNILSFYFDKLEDRKIAMPLTKNLLLTKQKDILYLLDINNKDRWIDEKSYAKTK